MEASNVYRSLGEPGLGTDKMPPVNQPVMQGTIAYRVRTGKHDVTAFDWDQYPKFAEMQFAKP